MIHKKIITEKLKEFEIKEFVEKNLNGVGLSKTKLIMTPLGEKIVVNASRPGLVVGRKGQFIKKLTENLKERFSLDNPQIEINVVEKPDEDANIVAERIANSLERFGTKRFKGVGHKSMDSVMRSGALGVEILISGKVPSARSKRWRFYTGYLKKSGEAAQSGVKKAYKIANLKSGSVGIQVRIMPADITLGDDVKIIEGSGPVVEVEETDIDEKTEKEELEKIRKAEEQQKESSKEETEDKKKKKAPSKKSA